MDGTRMGLIRQDAISKLATLLAGTLVILLLVFDLNLRVLFPGFLLVFGIIFDDFTFGGTEDFPDDSLEDPRQRANIMQYTAMAFLGLAAGSMVSANLHILPATFPITSTVGVPVLGIVSSGLLLNLIIAVSEEQFFRSFLTNWMISRGLPPFMVILLSTVLGVSYHMNVYGTQMSSLVFVGFSWSVLTFVAIRSRRLSPGIIAHTFNNFMASTGRFGIITGATLIARFLQ